MDFFKKPCPKCEKRSQERIMEKTLSLDGKKEWRCPACNYFEKRLF